MRRVLSFLMLLLAAGSWTSGCAPYPAPMATPPVLPVAFENPVLLPPVDRDYLFNHVVDVVDGYFTIDREEPVRLIGDQLTEGRIDTFPEVGSTLFEPWRDDSANRYERLESTLQVIRRQAVVRVIPSGEGYFVDVAVFKELEDVPRPEFASAGAATFRHDGALGGVREPVGEQPFTQGWIPLGRDLALEQQIIAQLKSRFAGPVQPLLVRP